MTPFCHQEVAPVTCFGRMFPHRMTYMDHRPYTQIGHENYFLDDFFIIISPVWRFRVTLLALLCSHHQKNSNSDLSVDPPH